MNLTNAYGGVETLALHIFYSLRGYIWAQADRQETSDTVWKTSGIGDKKNEFTLWVEISVARNNKTSWLPGCANFINNNA